ncbi:MAG: esterase-like activity of phytase family protein [Pseudomonadota bacterium]
MRTSNRSTDSCLSFLARALSVIRNLSLVILIVAACSAKADYSVARTQLIGIDSFDSDPEHDISGLSGLAWDYDQQILWAVSDLGFVASFELLPNPADPVRIRLVEKFPLNLKDERLTGKKWLDAEGLALARHDNGVAGDTELIVSFERRPRLEGFNARGEWTRKIEIPEFFKDAENYRHSNNALESVTHHPKFGWILGIEFPYQSENENLHTIFTADGVRSWRFARSELPGSALTGLQWIQSSRLITLERAYVDPLQPFYTILRVLDLDQCGETVTCEPKPLLQLNSHLDGPLDNFEGIAKIDDSNLILVSDNNGSDVQQTLFMRVQFEHR